MNEAIYICICAHTHKLKTRRTVPWWNNKLKILQKKVNAVRQYQQTLNNDDLRSEKNPIQ